MAHLASGYTNSIRFEGFADCFVSKDVVWGGWLLNEPRFELFEMLHILDSFWNRPDLNN